MSGKSKRNFEVDDKWQPCFNFEGSLTSSLVFTEPRVTTVQHLKTETKENEYS